MDLRTLLVIFHTIGAVLGAGGATVNDLLFFSFAKKGTIERHEYDILKIVSRVIILGLCILIASGLGFLLLNIFDTDAGYNMGKVWTKIIIAAILSVNGVVLHKKVLPIFARSLGKPFATADFIKKSVVVLTAGAISAVSWYSALILGAWRSLGASYPVIMGVYATIVLIAILFSNIVGRVLIRHLQRTAIK